MREGFDAPTVALPKEDVRALRAFFDGQSRIKLAVWVRHEHRGRSGPIYDHHLAVGVPDDDYATGDMWALELGMPLPALQFGEPQWIPDIFALSEVETLRAVGTVLWEGGDGADPLDFKLTYEPLEVDAEALGRFADLVAAEPGIRGVYGTRERLWEGDEEIRQSNHLYVDAEGVRVALSIVGDAAHAAGLVADGAFGASLAVPRDPQVRTATLYEARA